MKEQEINIAEILKNYPTGTKLYSPTFGELFLEEVGSERIYTYKDSNNKEWIMFYPDGKYNLEGECSLFLSKDQRDWSKFEMPVMPPFEIKRNEQYYSISSYGIIENKDDLFEQTGIHKHRFDIGNYFNTREQAEYAAEKVKELLLSLRKEAGNE